MSVATAGAGPTCGFCSADYDPGTTADLRSMTQGQGTFTMEPSKYRPVPANIQTVVIAERKAELQPG